MGYITTPDSSFVNKFFFLSFFQFLGIGMTNQPYVQYCVGRYGQTHGAVRVVVREGHALRPVLRHAGC